MKTPISKIATFSTILAGFIVWVAGQAAAQENVNAALGKLAIADPPIVLLGGRLNVKVPAGAKLQPRGHNIMAAAQAAESESRVVVDAGKERLVLMAYEVCALAQGEFEKGVRADVARSWGKDAAAITFEKLAVAKPLAAIAVTPPPGDGKDEANLVLGVYVRQDDDAVQYLAFYVNRDAAADAAGSAALARKIASTLTAGNKALARKAGPRTFPGVGDDRLSVTVPDDFVVFVQKGSDFSVYQFRKLVPLGHPSVTFGIYLGNHPAYNFRQAGGDPKVTDSKGQLLGREVEWKSWSIDDSTTNEVIVVHPKDKDFRVHVFCSARTEAELRAVRAMAETLQVVEAKK